MIAILIFSVGVLAIVGLQATMIKNTADSKYRAEASYIAQQRIGLMWADPDNVATYVETNTDIADCCRVARGPSPSRPPASSRLRSPGSSRAPNQTTHNFTTTARITGG